MKFVFPVIFWIWISGYAPRCSLKISLNSELNLAIMLHVFAWRIFQLNPDWARFGRTGPRLCIPVPVTFSSHWSHSCYISVTFPVTFHFEPTHRLKPGYPGRYPVDTSVGSIQCFKFPEICRSSPVPRFPKPVPVRFMSWDRTRYPIFDTDRFWTWGRSGRFQGQTRPLPDRNPLLILVSTAIFLLIKRFFTTILIILGKLSLLNWWCCNVHRPLLHTPDKQWFMRVPRAGEMYLNPFNILLNGHQSNHSNQLFQSKSTQSKSTQSQPECDPLM